MLEEGKPAPEFSLMDADGKPFRLTSAKGAPVVVYFYPRDDTPGCTAEAKDFTLIEGELRKHGASVVGISPDGVASHCAFRDKHGLSVRLLSDEGHKVAEAYGVWVEKSMYGKTYMGVERATFLIDRGGRIARIWHKVRVPGHAAEVLEAVAHLGASR